MSWTKMSQPIVRLPLLVPHNLRESLNNLLPRNLRFHVRPQSPEAHLALLQEFFFLFYQQRYIPTERCWESTVALGMPAFRRKYTEEWRERFLGVPDVKYQI